MTRTSRSGARGARGPRGEEGTTREPLDAPSRRPSRYAFSTRTVRFESGSGGETCVGDLYLPDRPTDPPVVVMAPGLGAERTFGLPTYAERFAERGYAALAIDYRGFGDSDGTPRRLVDPERQATDLRAALDRARTLDGVAGDRAVLWGFSLGGGHALRAAAEDRRAAAVVGVMPMTDGRRVVRGRSPGYRARALLAGLRDRVQSLVAGPHEVPIVGDPDEFALLNRPGVRSAFLETVPEGADWENATPARVLLTFGGYRPVADAPDVTCPVLLVAGARDEVVPAGAVADAAADLPDATLLTLPVGHYDAFRGRTLERLVGHQLVFLDSVLG